jgi:NAD+ synthase (glutamine-hydrolysing)
MSTLTFEGFKIGLCQQPCVPADPASNAQYFVRCIEEAEAADLDLLVGVEAMQGYLIGDQYEYTAFLEEVEAANETIQKTTTGKKVAVTYGSVVPLWAHKGEDGRTMKWNGGVVLQNGALLQLSNKTLQPNYRMFNDSRHMFEARKEAEKIALETTQPLGEVLKQMLRVATLRRRDGEAYRLGQILCEDMWDADYAIKPTLFLAENGADIIVNHSASPWTWRKNNKRHRVVKALMQGIPPEIRPKLFVYCNRVGVEQQAKNFYVFDGSSAVYGSEGDLIFEVEPYRKGTAIFSVPGNPARIEALHPDDTKSLDDGLSIVIDEFFGPMPDSKRFVLVGLSGGIDSSVMAAKLVSRPCLGPNRVIGVNMPYADYNSQDGKDDAKALAQNLGIPYLHIPITEMTDAAARATGVERGTLTHENIQARMRMEVLAALAQKTEQINGLAKTGGVFTANGNKVEWAFGYGTMYADIAGAIALFMDLVKREIYQIGDFLNRNVFGFDAIPRRTFERVPTAELAKAQVDPFFYGGLEHRGYHDEWVRAVTEFRWDPDRFLEEYLAGTLEKSFLLEPGTLMALFPTAQDFVSRLEKDWADFTTAYRKRIQAPPGPVFSRRAFGGDLNESLYAFPLTANFIKLKARIPRHRGAVQGR